MGKNSFVIGSSWAKRMLDVPDEDFAAIVKAVFQFAVFGEHDQVNGLQKALVAEMTDFLAENAAKYEEVCEKRKAAGSAGGKQKAENTKQSVANASKCYQKLANASKRKQNVADNDNDNDNEYDNDNDNDDVSVLNDRKEKKMCSNEHMKEIVDEWNKTFAQSSVPKVTILKSGSKREKQLKARLDEFGLDKIRDAIKTASESSFLRDSSWFSFDWFICPSNFVKIVEGNYTERGTQNARPVMVKHGSAEDLQNFYDSAVAWAQGG